MTDDPADLDRPGRMDRSSARAIAHYPPRASSAT
jgi:hypothetical protein